MSSELDRRFSKIKLFNGFVRELRTLSTCKRAQVGAIIVTRDLSEILAIGYNGRPSHCPNDGCREEVGQCGCIHAEANALIKRRPGTGVMICTVCPCEHCAGLIVNSKAVTHVLYDMPYRNDLGIYVLHNGGVSVRVMDDNVSEWWPARY